MLLVKFPFATAFPLFAFDRKIMRIQFPDTAEVQSRPVTILRLYAPFRVALLARWSRGAAVSLLPPFLGGRFNTGAAFPDPARGRGGGTNPLIDQSLVKGVTFTALRFSQQVPAQVTAH